MGSRGAFVSVSTGNFTFKSGGQNYFSLGTLSTDSNVKILVQDKGSVKAPEYSHTENRVYAITQDGKLKHVAFYDENHNQTKIIDLLHAHGSQKLQPHIHYHIDHSDDGIPINDADRMLIEKIKKEYKLK